MPHTTAPDLLVLHVLRCIGFASLDRIAEASGRSVDDVRDELIDLGAAGLAKLTPGDFGGWGLTDAGRAADAERIADELDTAGAREAVHNDFERFLVLNPKLLDICTAWQMRPVGGTTMPNDHSDPAYDGRVLDRLSDIDRRVQPIIADLSSELSRFGLYRSRLAGALDRVEAGDIAYVADNTSSYHTVWFQLHEDLLVTLGLSRT